MRWLRSTDVDAMGLSDKATDLLKKSLWSAHLMFSLLSPSHILRGYQNPLDHLQAMLVQELGDLTQSSSQDMRLPVSCLPWAGSWPALKAGLSGSGGQMLAAQLH